MDKEWVDEDDMMIADLYKEQERRKNRRKELMKIVEHAPILEILEKECKERLNDDKQRYVNETILKAEMAAAFNDSRMLFKCVKALKPWQPRKIPLIKDASGKTAETPLQAREVWKSISKEFLEDMMLHSRSWLRSRSSKTKKHGMIHSYVL